MTMLNEQQRQIAVEAMREYLSAPIGEEGMKPEIRQEKRDRDRAELIDGTLKPLVDAYLTGRVDLSEFKTQIDGLNKRNTHWGFKGIKGQMFFNQIVNTATDQDECDQEIKAAILTPDSEEIARSRIRGFVSYTKRLGDELVAAGGTGHGRPKFGSVPFFLSYFWQIQDRTRWPVYYTNSVQVMGAMNLWQPKEDLGQSYVEYLKIHEELSELFTREAKKPFGLYDVEHVFWFKGGDPRRVRLSESKVINTARATRWVDPVIVVGGKLPESYVPPIVAVLPQLALNEAAIGAAAEASGTSVERAFEKCINAAFTILGYQTTLLGQGGGRVPDGLAVEQDSSYAIIWDAKARMRGYALGTDDRAIREYIKVQSRELKKRKGLRNVYYALVSSAFADDFDAAIRDIKMDTDVSEVCLLEAGALVAIVEQKLRDPLQVSLGPDGVQRLFATSGVLTADEVRETLG